MKGTLREVSETLYCWEAINHNRHYPLQAYVNQGELVRGDLVVILSLEEEFDPLRHVARYAWKVMTKFGIRSVWRDDAQKLTKVV